MKQDLQNSMKRVSVNADQMQLFVIINNVGIKTNVDANVKNQLRKEYVIMDLFGILVIVTVNVINRVMFRINSVNIQTMKVVNAEKKQLINC